MTMYRTLICAATVLMLVNTTACKAEKDQANAPATGQPVVVQPEGQQATPPPMPLERAALQGKILETMDASGYTYVNLETETGPVWAAMPETKVEVGQEIALSAGMEMGNFESKTLGRTFDSIIFSGGIMAQASNTALPAATASAPAVSGGESFAEAMQGEAAQEAVQPMATSGGSQGAMAESEEVMVEKAEGENAYTVGEVFEKKSDLDKQKVVIRGKIVKVSMGIMGKNWIHLQDGTGDVVSKTHDLVVTTAAQPEKGAVVVVEGTLAADRDFGSGYRYDVIIEDAEVK